MREIKFRIPHFDRIGKFVRFTYWGTIDHKGEPSLDHGVFTSPSSDGLTKGWHEQFAGLKDSNGTEIYEGDIVDAMSEDGGAFSHEGQWFVKFSEETASFMLYNPKPLSPKRMRHFEIIKIIGNIHSNPELLNPQP